MAAVCLPIRNVASHSRPGCVAEQPRIRSISPTSPPPTPPSPRAHRGAHSRCRSAAPATSRAPRRFPAPPTTTPAPTARTLATASATCMSANGATSLGNPRRSNGPTVCSPSAATSPVQARPCPQRLRRPGSGRRTAARSPRSTTPPAAADTHRHTPQPRHDRRVPRRTDKSGPGLVPLITCRRSRGRRPVGLTGGNTASSFATAPATDHHEPHPAERANLFPDTL